MKSIIVELQYILECLNGFVHGLGMPFKRCCVCGKWASSEWYNLKDGRVWCGCINTELSLLDLKCSK